MVSASKIPTLRSFYRTILQPLGYTEMIDVKDGNICGFGSDYPYFWLSGCSSSYFFLGFDFRGMPSPVAGRFGKAILTSRSSFRSPP